MKSAQTAATQLDDQKPSIDMPLRVKATGNVPERAARKGKDEELRLNAFSPYVYVKTKEAIESAIEEGGDINTALLNSLSSPKMQPLVLDRNSDATAGTAIKDATMVASSSKRVGKKDVEADAYLSLGIIHDNQNNLKEAIDHYKKYVSICEEVGDIEGQSVANNCIGVSYMYLCCKNQPGILHTLRGDDPDVSSSIQLAMEYHEKHLRITDIGGQFIALTNLGLCYGVQRNIVQSAKCHQDALRAAIKMQSIYGQSIAVGNLGMLAILKSDYKTARTCYEQHLNLVQALHDKEAEMNAWKMLAELSAIEGSSDAIENLQEAQRVAAKEGYTSELRRIHCLLGRATGSAEFYEYANTVVAECIAHDGLNS